MKEVKRFLIATGFTVVIVAIAATIAILFSGCAIVQKATEFLNPQYQEITVQVNGTSFTFNGPAYWPTTEEFVKAEKNMIRFYNYFVLQTRHGDEKDPKAFNILVSAREEKLEVMALSDNTASSPGIWYILVEGKLMKVPYIEAMEFINQFSRPSLPTI